VESEILESDCGRELVLVSPPVAHEQEDDHGDGKQRDTASDQDQQLECVGFCARFGLGDAKEWQR
jgi:hypothetical protein